MIGVCQSCHGIHSLRWQTNTIGGETKRWALCGECCKMLNAQEREEATKQIVAGVAKELKLSK